MTTSSKKIIVAPLNWGLGHATRCIPIIKALISENFTPIIASDGKALLFLQQEFPDLEHLILPSYNIKYGKNLKWNLLLQLPKIVKAVQLERLIIENFVAENSAVVGVISDNRFGVRSKKIPSVYITHQVNVLSGFSTFFTSKIHQNIIKKFSECWIPDEENSIFSGKLSASKQNLHQKFIGVLSRLKKEEVTQNIDVLVLISGPEPNRTNFEKKIISQFKNDQRNVVFVLGKVEKHQKKWNESNVTIYNYLLSKELQKIINAAKIVVCRSGYSSIMDLAVLHKKVFFIPTKNQPEQAYLASYFKNKELALFSNLKEFTSEKIKEVDRFKGLKTTETLINIHLFRLFQCK